MLAIGMGALALAAGAVAGAQERFVQDRFAIGFWVDPPLDERADERYQEIAEANFTMIIGGFGGANIALIERQLALCEKYDLRAVVASHGIEAANLPDGPACWGYKVRDEPSAEDFPALRARVDEIRAARPGRLAYINLFPNYANERQLGTPTYEEHVRRFIDEVGVDVLSMDHYPRFKPDGDGRDAYCENLEVMRAHSLRADIPFWNFFNIMPYGPHTDPTEDQLRWQIYATLTYGCKGILYFCYFTPAGDEFPKGGAIIRRDDSRTRHYDQAKRLNAGVKNLGPTLMQLTSTGVRRVTGDGLALTLEDAPIRRIVRDPVDPPHDYLVGAFTHADGRRAVMLTNYRFAYTAWPTVEFDADPADVVEVDKATGNEIPLYDESPDMEGYQLSLDAGEGRLFLLAAR